MSDIDIKMTITTRNNKFMASEEQIKNIEYVLNEACSKLESLACDVYYRLTKADN